MGFEKACRPVLNEPLWSTIRRCFSCQGFRVANMGLEMFLRRLIDLQYLGNPIESM